MLLKHSTPKVSLSATILIALRPWPADCARWDPQAGVGAAGVVDATHHIPPPTATSLWLPSSVSPSQR